MKINRAGISSVGTGAGDLAKAEDAVHASGDTGVMLLGVRNDNAGVTTNTDGDYAAVAISSRGALHVGGAVLHDVATSGNPILMGAYATNAPPADVSAVGDAVRLAAGLDGVLFVRERPRTPWTLSNVGAGGAQATASKASAGAGLKNVCRGFWVSVQATGAIATAEAVTIVIRDGATGAGTVLWSFVVLVPINAAVGSLIYQGGLSDIYLEGTAATAMTIESNDPTDTDIIISVNAWGEVSA